MIPPSIAAAKKLGELLGARGLIVLAISDEGQIAGASWGRKRADCREMGKRLDAIVDRLERDGDQELM